MKTLLIALCLGLVLSTNVLAKKAQITSTWDGGDMAVEILEDQSCKYACLSTFYVSYHIHRDTSLGLQLLVGDGVSSLETWVLQDNQSGTRYWTSGCFVVPAGETLSLVWVLENTKRVGKIIDAEEVFTTTCNP